MGSSPITAKPSTAALRSSSSIFRRSTLDASCRELQYRKTRPPRRAAIWTGFRTDKFFRLFVIPAKAPPAELASVRRDRNPGVEPQGPAVALDPRFRGGDDKP